MFYVIKNVDFIAHYLNPTHKQKNYYAFENDFGTLSSSLFQNIILFLPKVHGEI